MSTFFQPSLRMLLFSMFCIPFLFLQAQPDPQVIVANGGVFGPANLVTIGTWNQVNNTYTVFDSLPASSVQHLIVDGDTAYLAADSFLVKYDLSSQTRLHSTVLSGVRKLRIYQDKLLVTRGFGASSDFVQAFNKSDLSHAWSVTGISGQCEGIDLFLDTAFVAVPGAFGNAVGHLAAIDLTSGQLLREIPFDTFGVGISRVVQYGDDIWTVSPLAFGTPYGYISRYNVGSGIVQHFREDFVLLNGVSINDGNLYLFADGNLGAYNMQGAFFLDPSIVPGSWAAVAVDQGATDFYLTETDYSTYGILRRFNSSGMQQDSVVVGISPEAIALYHPLPQSASNSVQDLSTIMTWPNPAADFLQVERIGKGPATLKVRDVLGREMGIAATIYRDLSLDVSALPAGTYLLTIREKAGVQTLRFVK